MDAKKTTSDKEVCRPEGLGAMLEYRYIKGGLLKGKEDHKFLSHGRNLHSFTSTSGISRNFSKELK